MSGQLFNDVDTSVSNVIVADHRDNAMTVQRAIERIGYGGPEDQFVPTDQVLRDGLHVTNQHRVLVVVSDVPDRAIDVVRFIRQMTTAPIFVIGPREADLILNAVNAGAEGFVDDSAPIDLHLADNLARGSHTSKAESPYGRLICVTAARGGAGSSLTAVNLAVAIAKRLKRVALCDFDLATGTCDALLNLRPKHNVTDLSRCYERMEISAVEMALTRHSSGVHLLASGSYDGRVAIDELFQRVLRTMRQMFPAVVVDLPRLTSDFDSKPILSACHKFVMVVPLDFNSIRSARRELDVLAKYGVPLDRLVLVGNRNGQPSGLLASDAEQGLGRKFAILLPDDSKTINGSINSGSPYQLTSASSHIGKALDTLASAVLSHHSASPANATLQNSRWNRINDLLQQCHDWLELCLWQTKS